MTDLADVLARQAAEARPHADLDDVHRRIRRRRRRTRTTQFAGVSVAIAVVAGGLLLVRPARQPTPAAVPPEVSIEAVGALVLTGPGAVGGPPHGFIERVDLSAGDGPRSAVLRPDGGELGRASLVITAGEDPSSGVPSGDTTSTIIERDGSKLTARAIGIPAADVASIVAHTDVIDGRPSVRLPGRLGAYSIVSAATSRPPAIREGRYGCEELGEPTLAGLCFTGLTTSAGFEDAIYAAGFRPGPVVNGYPSVFSTILASGVLAWEPQPGVIAYVGFSGNGNALDAIDALARLAERTTFISSVAWRALDPQRGDQTNNWR